MYTTALWEIRICPISLKLITIIIKLIAKLQKTAANEFGNLVRIFRRCCHAQRFNFRTCFVLLRITPTIIYCNLF